MSMMATGIQMKSPKDKSPKILRGDPIIVGDRVTQDEAYRVFHTGIDNSFVRWS